MLKYIKNSRLDYKQIATRMVERIQDAKKVSRNVTNKDNRLPELEYALELIDCINQEPDYVNSYEGVRFEDIPIPAFLSDFVGPSKVSLKPDTKYPDLRKVHSVDSKVPVDLGKLKRLCDIIDSVMRTDAKPVTIDQLRRPKTLDEVRFCVTDNSVELTCTDGSSDYFVPVPVVDQVLAIVGNHVANEDANYILGLYLDYIKF